MSKAKTLGGEPRVLRDQQGVRQLLFNPCAISIAHIVQKCSIIICFEPLNYLKGLLLIFDEAPPCLGILPNKAENMSNTIYYKGESVV